MKRLLFVLLALSGCNAGTGLAASGDPTEGIYQLTIKTNSDTCQPARPTGDLKEAGVLRSLPLSSPGLSIQVPLDLSSWELLDLAGSDGYSYDKVLPFGIDCAGSSEHLQLQKIGSAPDLLEVSEIQDWTVSQPCGHVGGATKSCHSDQVLTYELITPCVRPMMSIQSSFVDGAETMTCVHD